MTTALLLVLSSPHQPVGSLEAIKHRLLDVRWTGFRRSAQPCCRVTLDRPLMETTPSTIFIGPHLLNVVYAAFLACSRVLRTGSIE